MAEFGNEGFNAEAPENNQSNIVPEGEYDAVITESQKVECKAPKVGAYLKLKFQICSGEFQNRVLYQNLNIWLPENTDNNKTAVQISKGHLSAICRAVGVLNPKDSAELHNKPLRVKVTVRPAKGEYGPQNNITTFKPRGFASPPVTSPPDIVHSPGAAGAVPAGNPWG